MEDLSPADLERSLRELGDPRPRRIVVHQSIDSTSSDLRRRLPDTPPGTLVAATHQTGGRGRQGRQWCSDPAGNLYLSLSVALSGPPRRTIAMLPLAAGAAAHEAIRTSSGLTPRLKWPNDVLAAGKKLAGLLTEAVSLAPDRAMTIVGLGVNVGQTRFPESLREIATSIALVAGRPPRLAHLAAQFVLELEARVLTIEQGPPRAIVDDWLERAEPFGRSVRVDRIEGVTKGLSPDGRLIVVTTKGEEVLIAGGIVEGTDRATSKNA